MKGIGAAGEVAGGAVDVATGAVKGVVQGAVDALPDAPQDQGSCLAVMTDSQYKFRIENTTSYTLTYTINGVSYTLNPHYWQDYSYQHCFGSNSCNVKCEPAPTIKFDSNLSAGLQEKSYALGTNKLEKFVEQQSGGQIELIH